eukprot:2609316-Prymnesium_polylepis.1
MTRWMPSTRELEHDDARARRVRRALSEARTRRACRLDEAAEVAVEVGDQPRLATVGRGVSPVHVPRH